MGYCRTGFSCLAASIHHHVWQTVSCMSGGSSQIFLSPAYLAFVRIVYHCILCHSKGTELSDSRMGEQMVLC